MNLKGDGKVRSSTGKGSGKGFALPLLGEPRGASAKLADAQRGGPGGEGPREEGCRGGDS